MFKMSVSFLSFKSHRFLFAFSFVFFLLVLLSPSLSDTINHFNNLSKTINFFYSSSIHQAFAQYAVAPPSPTGPVLTDPTLKAQIYFPTASKGVSTSMAFIGPNDILVLEKNTGKVNRIVNGSMLPDPVLDVAVANKIERGMLGIAVAPNVTPDGKRYVFLFYTQSGGNTDGDEFYQNAPPPKGNMIYRYEWVNGKLINPKILINLPANPGTTGRPDHNGGKLAIGPDGNVYAIIGEVGHHDTQAQNNVNGSLPDGTGGVISLTQNGGPVAKAPLGKKVPFNYYFAYGIRNSFGLAFDPVSGSLWDTENGPAYGDEINLIAPGFNSGWDLIQGYVMENPKNHTAAELVKISKGKYSDPKFEWVDPVGPTSLVFLNSDKLGAQYQNDLFVGDNNNGNLYHFKLSKDRKNLLAPDGTPVPKTSITADQLPTYRLGLGFGGITDLKVGPDGFLYVLANNGAIYRIVPSSFASSHPTYDSPFRPGYFPQIPKQLSQVSNSTITNKVIIVGVKGPQSFDPNPVKIKVGDTITWVNADIIAHTVTSGVDYDPLTSGKLFDSNGLITNDVYQLKFAVPGTYYYFCLFHPGMQGQIIVSK